MAKHQREALTAVAVRNLKTPGRHADGGGLYLVVDPSGAKRWVLRTLVHGKRTDIGLGGLSVRPLADARKAAIELRSIARAGGDPLAVRRQKAVAVPTFGKAVQTVFESHSPAWRNAKHRQQWLNTLKQYAFPELEDKRVNAIETSDVLRVLGPIWLAKPETARRVRQRIGVVMDWAKAAGHRAGENPVDAVSKGLPRQPEGKKHHASLPYEKVPTFLAKLRDSESAEATKLGFEFLILTAARAGEVTGAMWNEIDFDEGVWTVPASRMKAKKAHRVPLSPRCLEILEKARQLPHSKFVFAGQSEGKPLSTMAFLMLLRRMELGITTHGFRSAFRIWAAESTSYPREIAELALAHVNKDKTEAAYQRSDLFIKRRKLMEEWAAFVTTPPEATAKKVVGMKKSA